MIKIEAWSLEEAYTLASEKLSCSITEIECEITQYPSKGFLGIGRKKAILVAVKKVLTIETKSSEPIFTQKREIKQNEQKQKNIPTQQVVGETESVCCSSEDIVYPLNTESLRAKEKACTGYQAIDIEKNFFKDERDISEICEEISADINALFNVSCFELETVAVTPYDPETVLITFSGKDSALLIGKEGYRYKALSYLLFNWINSKYNLLIRLEIAEFLKNQEEVVKSYLLPLVEQVRATRRGQTKILDGVLIQIALKELRDEFPDLYVGVKTNEDGSKYIIINEFYPKQYAK